MPDLPETIVTTHWQAGMPIVFGCQQCRHLAQQVPALQKENTEFLGRALRLAADLQHLKNRLEDVKLRLEHLANRCAHSEAQWRAESQKDELPTYRHHAEARADGYEWTAIEVRDILDVLEKQA